MRRVALLAIVPLLALSVIVPALGNAVPRNQIQMAASNAAITLNPTAGKPGETVAVSGTGFDSHSGQAVAIVTFDGATQNGTGTPIRSDGTFQFSFRIPDVALGNHTVEAKGYAPQAAGPTSTPAPGATETPTETPTETATETATAVPPTATGTSVGVSNTATPTTAPTQTSTATATATATTVPPTAVPPTPTSTLAPQNTAIPILGPPYETPTSTPVPPTPTPTFVPVVRTQPTPCPTFSFPSGAQTTQSCGTGTGGSAPVYSLSGPVNGMFSNSRTAAHSKSLTLAGGLVFDGDDATATFDINAPATPPMDVSQQATCATTPTVGQPVTCTITETVGNNGKDPLDFSHTVVNNISANVHAVSASATTGSIAITGSTVVWNHFTLAPNQSASASIQVTFTPTIAQVSSQIVLSDGISADAVDVVTGTKYSITYGKVATGTKAAPAPAGGASGNKTPSSPSSPAASGSSSAPSSAPSTSTSTSTAAAGGAAPMSSLPRTGGGDLPGSVPLFDQQPAAIRRLNLLL